MTICNAIRARLSEAATTAISSWPITNGRTAHRDVQGERNNRVDQLVGPIALSILMSPLPLLKGWMLTLVVALIFAACSVLPPHQDRSHFILLAPSSTQGSVGAQIGEGEKLTSAAIGLGPIQLPEYLDRPELVIRTSPNGFELSGTERWAEPLSDNFRHVLASDLTNLLGTDNIVQYPWYPGTRLEYTVRVQVQRFEVDTSKTAVLVARWELRTPQGDQTLTTRDIHLSHAMTSLAGDVAAAALSDELAELAGQIASAVTQIEQQRLARGLR